MIRFGWVDVDNYRLVVPEGATYAEFDHGEQGKQIHVFFIAEDYKYRFTIDSQSEKKPAETRARELYAINAPLSIPEWRVLPYVLEESNSTGWGCGYGLMEGDGLRIQKIIFGQDVSIVTLTFSSPAAYFETGFDVFEKIARSFEIRS